MSSYLDLAVFYVFLAIGSNKHTLQTNTKRRFVHINLSIMIDYLEYLRIITSYSNPIVVSKQRSSILIQFILSR